MDHALRKHSRRYKQVVDAGCGGRYDYWGEFDCTHDYEWSCDDCPCRLHYEEEQQRRFVGPPEPDWLDFIPECN